MTVKTFAPENYRNCPIYYRQMNTHFEYLTVIDNQLYTAHNTLTPKFYRRVAAWLGWIKDAYSEKEYQDILKFLRALAETTINTIKDKK